MQAKLEALQAKLATARESDDIRAEIRTEGEIDALLSFRPSGRGLSCAAGTEQPEPERYPYNANGACVA